MGDDRGETMTASELRSDADQLRCNADQLRCDIASRIFPSTSLVAKRLCIHSELLCLPSLRQRLADGKLGQYRCKLQLFERDLR